MGRISVEEIIQRRRARREQVINSAKKWASKLKGPITAILVGSYARGDFNVWSDVDIVIVSPLFEKQTPLERLSRVDSPPGYEVIPWTPRELKDMISNQNPIAVEIIKHGIILRDDIGIEEKINKLKKKPS